MIKSISIHGLRGFGEKEVIEFAMPKENLDGSGITFIVGANNTGKTTIFEALRCFNLDISNPPSFSENKRNIKCENGKVHLIIKEDNDGIIHIDSLETGGSESIFKGEDKNNVDRILDRKIFVLQSRRFFDFEFGKDNNERDEYVYYQQMNSHNRTASIQGFSARLFKMQNNKNEFNNLLKRVLGYNLEWMIERNDNGTYYLKFIVNGCKHSSEGLGDGIWSVFTICDALYDSKPGDTIAIDEPELSLHPAYQKKIFQLFMEYSRDRQIILNTHSPYFVDFLALSNGAMLFRTMKNNNGDIEVYKLSDGSKKYISGFIKNINQPHILGLEAKEIFFLEDNIILTEGQEDVVMYNLASKQLNIDIEGTFFGWGAGGASNIEKIADILKDLGYKKILAIFDGDKPKEKEIFCNKFQEYTAEIISVADVRDKKEKQKEKQKEGLMTEKGEIKEAHREEIISLLRKINNYFA